MNITYTNEILDHYSGQTNCEAGIYVDDEIVGVVQYVLYNSELTVSDILIRPEFRRQGFGSRLMKYIKQENPGYVYKPSMKTTDGSLFKHKDISLKESKKAKFVNEAIGDFLKPKNPDEIHTAIKNMVEPSSFRIILKTLPSLAEYLKAKTFTKKLSQDDDWHKEYKELTVLKDGEWASTKDGKRKYWITKPLLDVTEIAKKIILNSIENLNYPPEKLKILHIEQSIEAPFVR